MSFYDDASLVFLAGGAAGKDGKAYNLKPVEELSSTEVVINGSFSIDGPGTDGELDTSYGDYGWNTVSPSAGTQEGTTTISNGVLKLTNALGETDSRAYATDGVSSRNVITTNTYYKLVYTIVENNGCTSFKVYNAGGVQEDAPSSVGTHTVILRNTSNQLFLFFNKTESSSISIDNVSIREITNQAADFTFTRGTNLTATRVGKDGYIEKGRENLLLQSNQFDTAPWGNSNTTNTTVQIGYDGTSDALLATVSGGAQIIGQNVSGSGVQTVSLYAKGSVNNGLRIFAFGDNNVDFWFNLNTGLVDGAVSPKVLSYNIENVGNGWYRCSFTFTQNTASIYFYITDNNRSNASSGSIYIQDAQLEVGLVATDYIETGASTATAGLLEDEPRFDYTGGGCPALLMEPTRTNYFTHSEYASGNSLVNSPVIEENYAISPEGVLNAFRIEDPSGGSYRRVEKSQSKTTDQVDWTFSVFVKKATSPVSSYGGIALAFGGGTANQAYVGFDEYEGTLNQLTGAASPTNANRLTLHTPVSYGDYWRFAISVSDTDQSSPTPLTNNNTSVTAILYANLSDDGNSISNLEYKDFVAYGMQFEEGLFPTSYIPTYGSSATRDQDVTGELQHGITMGTTCSVFFEGKHLAPNIAQLSFFQLRTDDNNRLLFFGSGTTSSTYNFLVQHRVSGTSTNATSKALNIGDSFKVLARMDDTTMDVFINGELHDTQTITAQDHFGKMNLYRTGAANQSGHEVSQAILFTTALSNNDSEILTGATSYSSFAAMATSTPLNYTLYE